MELDILTLVSNRESYTKYKKYIKERRLSIDIKLIYSSLEEYYIYIDPKLEIKWDEFYFWYTVVAHPSLSDDKCDILKALCTRLEEHKGAGVLVSLLPILERDTAAEIAGMALEIAEGDSKHTLKDILTIIQEVELTKVGAEGERTGARTSAGRWGVLADTATSGTPYHWRLNELERMLGPLRRGDFVIIGARPDGGKTTMLASEVTHFASQLKDKECVLWMNNEEPHERVIRRITQAALGWDHEEMDRDNARTLAEYTKAVGGEDRIIVYDNNNMTVADISEQLTLYKPSLIIIDQVYKIRGFEKEHKDSSIDRFGRIASFLRTVAKTYGPVICTSWLDGLAEGVEYPSMAHLYGSKTAVQGEVDAILLIGRSKEACYGPNARFLHAPKNKLQLALTPDRSYKWEVEIRPQVARFLSKIGR